MNAVRLLGLAFLLSLLPFFSYGHSCYFMGGVKSEVSRSVNFGNVIVQRDTPVGAVIATTNTGAYNNGDPIMRCNYRGWHYRFDLSRWQSLSPLGNNIYNTNLPGVGIRIKEVRSDAWLPFDWILNYGSVGIPDGVLVELIKTGDIQSGSLASGMLARASNPAKKSFANVVLNGVNTVTAVSCSVTTPNITVPLGRYRKIDFHGVGSATSWTDFDIGLVCNKDTRINVRIDAPADASAGAQGVMQLDRYSSDIVATGVGIQLGYRHTEQMVQFGEERFYWKSVYGGGEIVQLRARYYQTAPVVTAGKANGIATFTITYK